MNEGECDNGTIDEILRIETEHGRCSFLGEEQWDMFHVQKKKAGTWVRSHEVRRGQANPLLFLS